MKFYTESHKHYCGIDLHTKSMYLCILDHKGSILLQRNMKTDPELFLHAINPFREDLAVAVECIFTWYWLADICNRENITFVLGHALYMKAIHGTKSKNDKIDAYKIAALLRGGNLPVAYVYPQEMRATRDLLRRRMYISRKRAELLTHIQQTNYQYNLPAFGKPITRKRHREGIAEHFPDDSVSKSIETDLMLIADYQRSLENLESFIIKTAKIDNNSTLTLLRSIPGVGKILSLVFLYEIHDIARFPRVQCFASYARLIKPSKESAGKRLPGSGKKIGNAHLKWAFSEATVLLIRHCVQVKDKYKRLQSKHNTGKALGILTHKMGRTVFYMLKRKEPFDLKAFLT